MSANVMPVSTRAFTLSEKQPLYDQPAGIEEEADVGLGPGTSIVTVVTIQEVLVTYEVTTLPDPGLAGVVPVGGASVVGEPAEVSETAATFVVGATVAG